MPSRRIVCLAAILALAATDPLFALGTPNGTRAVGTAQQFEVFGSSAGPALFCSAGTFARRRLGASATDRVVMVRGYGPSPTQPGQRSAVFQLQGPEAKTNWGGGVLLRGGSRGVGQNRSVGHAISLCPSGRSGGNGDGE